MEIWRKNLYTILDLTKDSHVGQLAYAVAFLGVAPGQVQNLKYHRKGSFTESSLLVYASSVSCFRPFAFAETCRIYKTIYCLLANYSLVTGCGYYSCVK